MTMNHTNLENYNKFEQILIVQNMCWQNLIFYKLFLLLLLQQIYY